MPKAKPLDRIELTRRKMQMKTEPNHFGEVNKMAGKAEIEKDFALREIKFALREMKLASCQQVKNTSQQQDLRTKNSEDKTAQQVTGKLEQHFDKCPMCGAMALVHEGGCEHCLECGYDACGLH